MAPHLLLKSVDIAYLTKYSPSTYHLYLTIQGIRYMGIVPQTRRSQVQDAFLATTTSEKTRTIASPGAKRPQDLDQFKFRIVELNGVHYFQDVRFKAPHISEADEKAIVEFFEGRSLQGLCPELMTAYLGSMTVLPLLQDLVCDLQRILCD